MSVLFARTFVIGVAVAAPVGAMGALCIQRTLRGGFWRGLATGLGIATADGLYASVAAFGLAAVSSALVGAQTPVRLVGGAFLVWLGIRAMVARPEECEAGETGETARPLGLYASAVGLTLTNPATILAFGAVFASAGLATGGGSRSAATATAGVFAGSLAWWVTLVTVATLLRSRFTAGGLVWVNRASGLLVAAFGVVAIASAFA